MQTSQTEDDSAAEPSERVRALAGEHDDEQSVRLERGKGSLKRARHAVFVTLLRLRSVAAETAGIIDKLAVAGVGIPFQSERR